jgi:hypothetical protein
MPIARRAPARPIGRSTIRLTRAFWISIAALALSLSAFIAPLAVDGSTPVSVANGNGSVIDPVGFDGKSDAHLTSGPCGTAGSHPDAVTLPDGDYSFLVSTADGGTALSSDDLSDRGFRVSSGAIVSATKHDTTGRACPADPASGGPVTVALLPFGTSTDGRYRVTVAPTTSVEACFANGDATGFGCPNITARLTTFDVAGSADSSISATISKPSVTPGTAVLDHAAVGASAGTPTGTVVFYVCAASTCASGGDLVGSVDLASGAATSPAWHSSSAGTYAFRAEYWGDSTYAASTVADESQTITVAESPSPSGSPAPSDSSSPSASDSASPTGSASASPSDSASGSPSGSPSASPSGSDTASPSPTDSGASPSPSSTVTETPKPTPTRTPTPTPIRTPAPTPMPTPVPTPNLTTPQPYVPHPTVVGPTLGPANYGSCDPNTTVCYLNSPTFFGPGWGSASPVAVGGTQNPTQGVGSPPSLPPIALVIGGVGALGASNGDGTPVASSGTAGVEADAQMVAAVASAAPSVAGSSDPVPLGVGASGPSESAGPAEAVAAFQTAVASGSGGGAANSAPAGSVLAAQGGGNAPVADSTPAPSSGSVPLVVLGLIAVAGLALGWALLFRKPAAPRQ